MHKRSNDSRLVLIALIACVTFVSSCVSQRETTSNLLTISIIGMNDVHGELQTRPGRAGLTGMSGFIDAVRLARGRDNGEVLVIDAGDMWQGTLESNLLEGAAVVDVYNAIGVAAAAIGNHEFDFGPLGRKAIPESAEDDPRSALKQRATETNFPLLAANLIDNATGKPVDWPNVHQSTMVDVQGIKIGIVGVMTERALHTTISANTEGLAVAPLVETIQREAQHLRDDGANVVVVTAHAGGHCASFDDADDVSSCDTNGEIFRVAQALPAGLVDHIIGGHVHKGIAHIVNGIAITASYSKTRAFSRVDIDVDRRSGVVKSKRIFPPQQACMRVAVADGRCAGANDSGAGFAPAVYEGRVVTPNPAVQVIADRATANAEAIKSEKLGVYLEAAFENPTSTEFALANLMTDALLESIEADISMHNVVGGIRNSLSQGELTFGAVYEMFPFDNRIVVLELSGAELRSIIAQQAHNHRRRVGFSGMRVFVSCNSDAMNIDIRLADGRRLRDEDRITVVVNDYLALGGDNILTPVIPDGGFAMSERMPLARDVLVKWFREHSGALNPDDFLAPDAPKWNLPAELPASCSL